MVLLAHIIVLQGANLSLNLLCTHDGQCGCIADFFMRSKKQNYFLFLMNKMGKVYFATF